MNNKLRTSIIICTYLRPLPLQRLLLSIKKQTLPPDEVLVIDGSGNDQTKEMLGRNHFNNISYYKVPAEERGLTKQRNYGVRFIAADTDIVAFLDDDTELLPDYILELEKTFSGDNSITGVGGVALNENGWLLPQPGKTYVHNRFYHFEGFVFPEGQRNVLRNYLGLQSNLGPAKMPEFSHGRTCGFPLTGKIYDADLLIGMSFSFRAEVVKKIKFSSYFEGYGLYEDADFCIRALAFGRNVINTKVQLYHYHDPAGRPNHFRYGKMVVRNGWYVWRIRNPKPSLKARIKWNLISLLLTVIRLSNTFTTSERKAAFTEAMGRVYGWWGLLFSKPDLS